jgi:Domain of unknown function (DUF5625)
MFNSRKVLSTLQIIFLLALTSLGLTSCAGEPKIYKPPLLLPFDPGHVGSKTEFEVKIVEKRNYLLGIRFFIKATPEEAIRVGKVLGASKQIPGSIKFVELGVPATFRVQIYKQPGNQELLNELVDHPKTRVGGIGRTADVVSVDLEPGNYSVKLEYVQGAPELAALLPAEIIFAKSHHGK